MQCSAEACGGSCLQYSALHARLCCVICHVGLGWQFACYALRSALCRQERASGCIFQAKHARLRCMLEVELCDWSAAMLVSAGFSCVLLLLQLVCRRLQLLWCECCNGPGPMGASCALADMHMCCHGFTAYYAALHASFFIRS